MAVGFDFIFSFYNFLKWVKCQLMNGGQKCGVFCHDRTTAPPPKEDPRD
jgi:hypothetical protein